MFNAILINSKFMNIFEFQFSILEIIGKYYENQMTGKERQFAKSTVFLTLCRKDGNKTYLVIGSNLDLKIEIDYGLVEHQRRR